MQHELFAAIEPVLAEVESLEHVVVIGGHATAPAREYESLKSLGEPDAPPIDESSPAFLIYTSGTTGFPKGAVISHRAARMAAVSNALESELRPDDNFLMTFPMCHASGFQVPVHHCRGVPVVLFESFEPGRFLELVERHRVTRTSLAPTMAQFVLDHPAFPDADLSSVRTLSYGGMPMPAPIARRLAARFGDLSTGFGQSESTLLVTVLTTDDHRRALAGDEHLLESIGRPIGMAAVAVLDDDLRVCPPGEPGELCVRSDLVMSGYWNDPDGTAAALAGGWLHTGDIARADEEGYLYLVDRKKDLIISGGQNVYPTEVERVLHELPGIAQVAVVGAADPVYGERVVAFIVVADGLELTSDDVIAHCRARPRELQEAEPGGVRRRSAEDDHRQDQEAGSPRPAVVPRAHASRPPPEGGGRSVGRLRPASAECGHRQERRALGVDHLGGGDLEVTPEGVVELARVQPHRLLEAEARRQLPAEGRNVSHRVRRGDEVRRGRVAGDGS